ncbi:MFS transporter [soil metagenome]
MSEHGHQRGQAGYARFSGSLFAAGFATFLQVFDAQALIPAISEQEGMSAATAALTLSATTIGLAISVLPWSAYADRRGRVSAMKLSLLSATALAFLVPFVPGFAGVLFLRFALGLALGAVPAVAMAYIAEEMHPRAATVAAGTFVAGNSIGGIVGRLLAGFLGDVMDWRAVFFVMAVVGTLSAAAFWILVPEPRAVRHAEPPRLATAVAATLRNRTMVALFAQGFLLMGAFAGIYNYIGVRLVDEPFSIPASVVGLLFLIYLFGTVASRVSASAADTYGHRRVMRIGIVTMAAGMLITLPNYLPMVILGFVIFTVGCFSSHPIASGLSGRLAHEHRAQASALYQFSWLAGSSLLGWFLGVVEGHTSWTGLIVGSTMLCGLALVATTALPEDISRG